MEDIDIWRPARSLMTERGDAARFAAAQHVDDLFAKNDYLGAAVWTRVGRAIEKLARQKPRAGEPVN